jgi:hypothetical protein
VRARLHRLLLHADGVGSGMAAEWLTCAIVIAVCSPAFGHFETVRPLWTRIARWPAHLAVTGTIGAFAGRPWTFVRILGLPTVAAVFPTTWCLRHGIHPIIAEPRDATSSYAAAHGEAADRLLRARGPSRVSADRRGRSTRFRWWGGTGR